MLIWARACPSAGNQPELGDVMGSSIGQGSSEERGQALVVGMRGVDGSPSESWFPRERLLALVVPPPPPALVPVVPEPGVGASVPSTVCLPFPGLGSCLLRARY